MPVKAILRDAAKAAQLGAIGCEIALADLQDPEALARAIGAADAVQIILPVAPEEKDMRRSAESLVEALSLARPKRVLAISDYGAHVADDIGMPTLFRDFEARLGDLDLPRVILRSAEHMHNWARVAPIALASGNLPSFQDPVEREMPTIAAGDLGRIAADLLLRAAEGVVHAEGPRRYSASDVAAALSQLSGRPIQAQAVPRAHWRATFERSVPASLAALLIKANDAKNKGGLVDIEPNTGEVRYGTTELIDALRPLLSPGS